MSDKSAISKAFNVHFFEFMDDILRIFPENEDIKHTKIAFELFKKANPTSIIKTWHKYVYIPYHEVIFAGDIAFFIEKDYKSDLNSLSNSDEIMKAIDRIREPVRKMNPENREHSTKYIQNLCKLSNVYMNI